MSLTIGDGCLCIKKKLLAPGDNGLPGSLKEVLTGPHPAVSGPLPAPGDSGFPGSLKEGLTGPHPAVSGPLPATRQQRLAKLAEEGCWVPTHWWGFHLPRW